MIMSIKPVGVQGVWDIEVEEDHSYVAHGFINHNSSNPNLQNIPNKGGGKIKRMYVSRFGDDGMLVQADFSQVELRIAACHYDEPVLIDAYNAGEDLHALTASRVMGISLKKYKQLPDKEQKKWRTRAKRLNFGVLYGGGPPALIKTLRKDGVFITHDEAQGMIDAFFKAYPSLRMNILRQQRQVQDDGYLTSFTGRRRRVPEVKNQNEALAAHALRQSVNFPIQSGASDMTLMSLILLDEALADAGYTSKTILTVHDSIVFDVVRDELVGVSQLAKEIMENLPAYAETVLPGLDWEWLRVPILADFESGRSWGSLVSFDPAVLKDTHKKRKGYKQLLVKDAVPKTVGEIEYLMDQKHYSTGDGTA